MSKIRVAIIEDEIPAARLLGSMISSLRPEWEVLTLPGNIEECVVWFGANQHPDVVFLDIQLSDGNSFAFIEQAMPKSIIIFTTAYDEYALRAFTVNSIDYLLKPIHRERLNDAIEKFERISSEPNDNNQLIEVLQNLTNPDKKYRTRFLISLPNKMLTLTVDDIAYFYSENKITYAVTKEAKEYVIDLPLDRLTEQLDPDKFFRTNRQTIISIGSIVKIEPYFQNKMVVIIQPPFKEKILISKEKLTSFKLWLNY